MATKTPTLEIFYDPLSQPARSVLSLCKLAKVDFIPRITSVLAQDMRSKEYGRINPNKKVPAARDIVNGREVLMFESGAIMRYICNRYLPADNEFYPRSDPAKIARIEEAIVFHHQKIRPGARAFYSVNVAPMVGLADKFNVEEESKNAEKMAEIAEEFYREKGGAVNRKDLTIADLLILEEVSQYVYGKVDLERFPFVVRRALELFEREEVQEAHKSFWEMIAAAGFKVPLCWQKFVDPFLEEDDE